MNYSFFTGAINASAQQRRLDVLANNFANASTAGFKTQRTNFSELMYSNIIDKEGEQTQIIQGGGTRALATVSDFKTGSAIRTDEPLDYFILADGMFALRDIGTGEITYTRDGSFYQSAMNDGKFYLAGQGGALVLSQSGMPIVVENTEEDLETQIGVFNFQNKEGLVRLGENTFAPTAQSGEPFPVLEARLSRGYLENSNLDLAKEMTVLIETQRAFQMSLKMVQASDEIEQTINSLR